MFTAIVQQGTPAAEAIRLVQEYRAPPTPAQPPCPPIPQQQSGVTGQPASVPGPSGAAGQAIPEQEDRQSFTDLLHAFESFEDRA